MPTFEVVLEGRQGLEDMLTVLHYETTTGLVLDWAEIAEALGDEIQLKLLSALVPNASYLGITYRLDELGEVGIFEAFPGAPLLGTNGSGDTITQTAVNVSKVAAGGSRPSGGRIYQGGIAVEFAGPTGQWSIPLLDQMDSFWGDVRTLDQDTVEVLRMVIKASNPSAPNTVPYNPVTAIATKSNPVTLTRRKRGTGS